MTEEETRDILLHILRSSGIKNSVRSSIAMTVQLFHYLMLLDPNGLGSKVALSIHLDFAQKRLRMPYSFFTSLLKQADEKQRFTLLNPLFVEAGMNPKHFERLFREAIRKKNLTSLQRDALATSLAAFTRLNPRHAAKYQKDVEAMMRGKYPYILVCSCILNLGNPTTAMLDYMRKCLSKGSSQDRSYCVQYWGVLFQCKKQHLRKRIYDYLVEKPILPLLQRLARNKDRQKNHIIAQQRIDMMFKQFPALRPDA